MSCCDHVTTQTGSTKVGPIRFSNRSNNCRVGKMTEQFVDFGAPTLCDFRLFVVSASNKYSLTG